MPVESSRVGDPGLARLIGARIRHAREARGLSQGDLAQALGLSQAAVSTIESGSRPLRVEELVVVSRLVGRDADYFLAPAKFPHGPVGVTLRAEVASLSVPEYRAAVNEFLDWVATQPLPDGSVAVTARDPERGAQEVITATGSQPPPTDVNEAARKLGIGVFPRPFPDSLSGMIVRHGAGAVIGVNSLHSPERQRFSIAHEVGHLVLGHKRDHYVSYGSPQSEGDPPDYDWRDEKEANDFAAELLMPAALIRAEARTMSISRLRHRYNVSPAAMGFRLANLGLQST